MLAIDQFEELLTAAARPSAQKFLRFLRTLLSRSNGRLPVNGTMRSDYLDTYKQHAETLKPPFLELYRQPPFPWERVTDAITRVAKHRPRTDRLQRHAVPLRVHPAQKTLPLYVLSMT